MALGKRLILYFSVFICLASRMRKVVELYMYVEHLYHIAQRDKYASL